MATGTHAATAAIAPAPLRMLLELDVGGAGVLVLGGVVVDGDDVEESVGVGEGVGEGVGVVVGGSLVVVVGAGSGMLSTEPAQVCQHRPNGTLKHDVSECSRRTTGDVWQSIHSY